MIGVVYKLYCKNNSITEFYVGSSCDLQKRKYFHKYCCNNSNSPMYNLKVYKFIRDTDGFENLAV
jgi:predicted GIY-YIG superfamily endonuclease